MSATEGVCSIELLALYRYVSTLRTEVEVASENVD